MRAITGSLSGSLSGRRFLCNNIARMGLQNKPNTREPSDGLFVTILHGCVYKTQQEAACERRRVKGINASRMFVVFCKPILARLLQRRRLIARMHIKHVHCACRVL